VAYNRGIYLQRPSKNTKNLNQGSQYPGLRFEPDTSRIQVRSVTVLDTCLCMSRPEANLKHTVQFAVFNRELLSTPTPPPSAKPSTYRAHADVFESVCVNLGEGRVVCHPNGKFPAAVLCKGCKLHASLLRAATTLSARRS
jgi:hypothetical protein